MMFTQQEPPDECSSSGSFFDGPDLFILMLGGLSGALMTSAIWAVALWLT